MKVASLRANEEASNELGLVTTLLPNVYVTRSPYDSAVLCNASGCKPPMLKGVTDSSVAYAPRDSSLTF